MSPAPAEVHVWTACAADPSLVEECRRLLSDREADRAARFIFERDRTMAVVSRGLRRMVLGWYAQADPRALGFIEGAHGKPALAGAGSAVRFNVSHSGDYAVLAVGREREVGVDIERVSTDRDLAAIAAHAFSVNEQRALLELPAGRHAEAFYRCWTQKEAFIKMVGRGLQFPLDRFDVEVDPHRPFALLDLREPTPNAMSCRLTPITTPPGYAGALAVCGQPPTILSFTADPLTRARPRPRRGG